MLMVVASADVHDGNVNHGFYRKLHWDLTNAGPSKICRWAWQAIPDCWGNLAAGKLIKISCPSVRGKGAAAISPPAR